MSVTFKEPPHLEASSEAGVLTVTLGASAAGAGRAAVVAALGSEGLLHFARMQASKSAIVVLSAAGDLTQAAIDFATGPWLHDVAEIGCKRVAVVLDAPAALRRKRPEGTEIDFFGSAVEASKWLAAAGVNAPSAASRAAPGGDPTLVVKAARWAGRSLAVGRQLIASSEASPFLAVVLEEGSQRYLALKDGAADPGALLTRAAASLDGRVFEPEIKEMMPGARVLKYVHPLAASAIASRALLLRAAASLGARVIAVGVPTEGLFFATSAMPENGNGLLMIEGLTAKLFADDPANGISPQLFLVDGGDLKGLLRVERSDGEPKTSPVTGLKMADKEALPARCTAEVHLYLSCRGMSEERTFREIDRADGRVTEVRACPVGEDQPEIFVFRIADPGGVLGEGGVPGPSKILQPSEFLVWADILSKRAPGSSQGLTPGQIEKARTDMTLAAQCIEEVVKFVPPGASQVPAHAFVTEGARAMYQKEPGRFSAGRLEAVAGAYRGIVKRY